MELKLNTKFASAERSDQKKILEAYEHIKNETDFAKVFDVIEVFSLILNENRQIVYANSAFINSLGLGKLVYFLGNRPGEVINCIHAEKGLAGCGTSEVCRVCGLVNAVLEAQQTKKRIEKEATISSVLNGKLVSFELKIKVSPIQLSGKDFYIVTLKDISAEKRKENFERIFFHDIINLAGGLKGLMDMLTTYNNKNDAIELIGMARDCTDNLLSEINSFRILFQAENGHLIVENKQIDSIKFLDNCIKNIRFHPQALSKNIILSPDTADVRFKSDEQLLSRIIINMIKNAIEATITYDNVVVGATIQNDNQLRLWVKNDYVMPANVQLQIFNRSFSTKGRSRGLGTYSIKLLGEQYLGGQTGFISNEENKTVFYIDLKLM